MLPLISAALPLVGKVLEKVLPDEEARARAKLELAQMQGSQEMRQLEIQMSAIVAEAKSADKWTSRARPSFLYVIYLYILAAIPMGFLFSQRPEMAMAITDGVTAWLGGIPDGLLALFGTGYLGYTAARSWDKSKIYQVKSNTQ